MLGQTLDGHDLDLLRIGARGCLTGLSAAASYSGLHAALTAVLQHAGGGGLPQRCMHVLCLRTCPPDGQNDEHVCVAACHGRQWAACYAGEPGEGKRKVWVIHRQHPGESMAEWFCEGMLHRLLDRHDPVSRKVLEKAVFYVVRDFYFDSLCMNMTTPHTAQLLGLLR